MGHGFEGGCPQDADLACAFSRSFLVRFSFMEAPSIFVSQAYFNDLPRHHILCTSLDYNPSPHYQAAQSSNHRRLSVTYHKNSHFAHPQSSPNFPHSPITTRVSHAFRPTPPKLNSPPQPRCRRGLAARPPSGLPKQSLTWPTETTSGQCLPAHAAPPRVAGLLRYHAIHPPHPPFRATPLTQASTCI